jgi:multidrug efflux pump subunit AcrB
MVLAAQFQSMLHPFTAARRSGGRHRRAGRAGLGSTLNVFSPVGMILLIGLVSKNSILLVTYADDLRANGMDAVAAMREAGRIGYALS